MSTTEQVVATMQKITGGWFNPEAHFYLDEKLAEAPGVTSVLESVGFIDLEDIPDMTLERKRLIGDAVHYASRIIDETGEDSLDWDTVATPCVPYVLGVQKFVEDTGFKPEPGWIEHGVVGAINTMPCAGTPDRVGRLNGIKYRVAIDFKCAYAPQVSWKYQLAAYVQLILQHSENKKEHIARIAVQLKPDGSYKLHPYEEPRDLDTFVYSLAIVHAKIRDGIKWRKD